MFEDQQPISKTDADPRTRPGYKLHAPSNVTLATFLGSPLAGAFLLASNYRKLGRAAEANKAIGLGALATAAVLVLAFLLPEKFPNMVLPLAYTFAMQRLAKTLQEADFDRHVELGGEKVSSWNAAGVGLLGLLLVAGVVFAVVFLGPSQFGQRLELSSNEEIYYTEGATEADAKKLGASLKDIGFFDGSGAKSVQLSRSSDTFVVSFVLQRGTWAKPEVVTVFQQIGQQLSTSAFGGAPVEIRLCDDTLRPMKSIAVQQSGPGAERLSPSLERAA